MKPRIILIIATFIFLGIAEAFADPVDDLKKFFKEKDYINARNVIHSAIAQKPKDEDVYVLAGDVYYELAMTDSAAIMYDKAYQIESKENNIRRKLAKVYSDLGKHKEAIDLINKAIKDESKNVLNYLALGQAYIKSGDLNKADLEIRKAQRMDENLAAGWVALADLYFAQKVYALAIDNYSKALEIEETNIDARINLASSYYNMARTEQDVDLKNEYYSQSLNQWEIVANKDPKNAKAFWEAGRIYYYAELYENAARYLNKYVQLRPDHSIARYYLVESLYKINSCDALVENANIVSKEIDSVKTRVLIWSAECLYKTQKFAESVEAFKPLAAQNLLDADNLENLSNAYLLSGDTLTAIKSYENVIKLDKDRPMGLMRYGTLAYVMKDYPAAINYLKLRDEVVKDSLSPKMKYYLGLSYIFSENFQSAIPVFEQLLVEDPGNYFSYLYLSDSYIKTDNKEKGKELLITSIDKMTPNAKENENVLNNAYAKLNNIFMGEKKYNDMNKYSKAWTESVPNSSMAYFFLGLSYHGNKDQANACKNYKKAVTLDPTSELAKTAKKMISDLNCN